MFKAGWNAALHGPSVTALVEAFAALIDQAEIDVDVMKFSSSYRGHTTHDEVYQTMRSAAVAKIALAEFNKARSADEL